MKRGKYFEIPEGAADLEQLWQQAKPLDSADLPDWVWREHAGRYRRLQSQSLRNLAPKERRTLQRELRALERAGLLVDEDAADPLQRHIYVAASLEDERWSIGIYTGASPLELGPAPDVHNPVLTSDDVNDIPAAAVADPFMVHADGVWHMFFEVLNRSTGRGEIGLALSKDGYEWSYQQVVLVEPFHLSYPYVFEWMNEYYMVPERHQAGSIGLYQAVDFPTRWTCIGSLQEGPYFVDNSLVHHADRWWLFTETNPEVKHDTLRLFWADHLSGPWREHPRSPLISGDACSARPGGRPVIVDGAIIRFAQNCQTQYGTHVGAFAVSELTPTTYRERAVEQNPVLRPSGTGWNACGMHHVDPHQLSDGQWLACVDGWSFPGCL